jgi:hypothetical protein
MGLYFKTRKDISREGTEEGEGALRTANGPQVYEPAGRPVDSLELTKRWSL